jgi:hypothetical protein
MVMFTKPHQCFLRTTRNGLNVSSFFDLREQESVPTVELDLQDHEGEEIGATTLEGECDDELFHPETEEERVAALKKISSVKKYAFNKLALQDMVEYGTMLMGGTIVEERKKAILHQVVHIGWCRQPRSVSTKVTTNTTVCSQSGKNNSEVSNITFSFAA